MLERAMKTHAALAAKLAALACVVVITIALSSNAAKLRHMDFTAFWAAGKLALQGDPVAAYDVAVHNKLQLELMPFDGLMPFAYPPPFLMVVTPFALMPYAVATIVWVATTFALYLLAARRMGASAPWSAAAFPPVMINGIIAQNGLLTGAIFISGVTMLQRRPLLAGIALGCLVIKPHLAVLLPLALAAGGYWRSFAGAAVSSAGLALAAFAVFGVGAYAAFLEQLPLFSSIAAKGLVGWHKMASVYASLRLAGAGATFAWSVHILIALAAALAVALVWRSAAELEAKAALLAAASVLISPYVYLYDTVMLIVPFVWLARSGEDVRVMAGLWCIPLIVALQNWGFNETINPAPLLPICMIALIARRLRTGAPGVGPAASLSAA